MKQKTLLRGLVLALAAAFLLATANAWAVWEEDKAVTDINTEEIENSTLIIGAHLVHLSALTQTVYDAAQRSAEESGQSNIYYKSELADGTWFDITTASSLADITTGGTPVEDAVIKALFLTHHTKSDGITYDLRTGQPVSPADIRSPYELETMEELFPLTNQLQLMEETQSDSAAGEAKIERLQEFYTETQERIDGGAAGAAQSNRPTAQQDQEIGLLQAYHDNTVAPRGNAKEKEVLQALIDAVDASRRARVMAIVEEELDAYVVELQKVEDTAGSDDEEGEAGAAPDTALQSAANDSLTNVKNAKISYEGKQLESGSTILSQYRYEVGNRLIADCKAGDTAACDADLHDLVSLENILNSVTEDKAGELALLEAPLLTRGYSQYTGGLSAGESSEYQSAGTDALQRGIAKNYASTVNTWRSEYEFLIEAKCLRVANEEGLAYIEGLLEQAKANHPALVKNDGFYYNLNGCVEEHIAFLERKRRELELGAGGNALDRLAVEKGDLQQQMMEALDKNDLAGAKAIQGEIDKLDEAIGELGADPNASTEGTAGGLVSGLKTGALEAVRSGDAETAADLLDALADLMEVDAALAFQAIAEVRSAMAARRDLDGDSSFDTAIALAEQAILDNKELFDAFTRDVKNADDLAAIAESFFAGEVGDGSVTSLTSDATAPVYLLALDLYRGETGSGDALRLMQTLAQRQRSLGNPLVFERVNDGGVEYLPASAIANYCGMRHVWNRNKNEATLALGGGYHLFTIYSKTVMVDGSTREEMPAPAKYLGEAHIPEDYTYQAFGVEALYVPGTGYGALVSDEIAAHADALFGLFMA